MIMFGEYESQNSILSLGSFFKLPALRLHTVPTRRVTFPKKKGIVEEEESRGLTNTTQVKKIPVEKVEEVEVEIIKNEIMVRDNVEDSNACSKCLDFCDNCMKNNDSIVEACCYICLIDRECGCDEKCACCDITIYGIRFLESCLFTYNFITCGIFSDLRHWDSYAGYEERMFCCMYPCCMPCFLALDIYTCFTDIRKVVNGEKEEIRKC